MSGQRDSRKISEEMLRVSVPAGSAKNTEVTIRETKEGLGDGRTRRKSVFFCGLWKQGEAGCTYIPPLTSAPTSPRVIRKCVHTYGGSFALTMPVRSSIPISTASVLKAQEGCMMRASTSQMSTFGRCRGFYRNIVCCALCSV